MASPVLSLGGQLRSLVTEYMHSNSDTDFILLKAFVASGEFRDEEFDSESYNLTFSLLKSTLISPGESDLDRVSDIRSIVQTLIGSPEFLSEVASVCVPLDLGKLLVFRASPSAINQADISSELSFIQSMLLLLYEKFPHHRCHIRREIGSFLRQFILIPTRTSFLTPILNVLNSIISGSSSPPQQLLTEILLPLHRPNGWSFWDRQTPVLAEYHKPLLLCCLSFVSKDSWASPTIARYILSHCFPPPSQTNTPKELLLLFELCKLASISDPWPLSLVTLLVDKLTECIRSENAQIVQGALLFWKSADTWIPHLGPHLAQFIPALVQALFRDGEPHWNPTVNKMTLLTLKALKNENDVLFEKAASEQNSFASPKILLSSGPMDESLRATQASAGPSFGITGVYEQSVDIFMQSLSPAVSTEVVPTWETALSCASPTLLPSLRFNQLVFGRDLGSGAFSTVRYARVIQPGTYLSSWPEVAVKFISFATIKKNKYLGNIAREIACLEKLAHPGIARLLASFYWRDGVYLVLEYGARGDLYTFIRSCGPQGESTVKILLGELVAALLAVHECGFVYGDLKPENVVITVDRHLKLTDFGACRFSTIALWDCPKVWDNITNADWKDQDDEFKEVIGNADLFTDNSTFEATSVYLPPEDTLGGPTLLGDAWAVGLVGYYLIRGRLPPWVGALNGPTISLSDLISTDLAGYEKWSCEFRHVLQSLLQINPSERASVEEIANHPWFDAFNVRTLYKQQVPETHLVGGSLTVEPDNTAWSKRQLSKIWSAQPQDFSLEELPACPLVVESDIERACLF